MDGLQVNETLTNVIRCVDKIPLLGDIILVRIMIFDYDCRYFVYSSCVMIDWLLWICSSRKKHNTTIYKISMILYSGIQACFKEVISLDIN